MIAALLAVALAGQYCQPSYGYGYRGYGYGNNGYGYQQQYYNYNNGYVDRLLFLPLATPYAQQATVTVPAATPSPSAQQAAPMPDPVEERLARIEAAVAALAECQARQAQVPVRTHPPPAPPSQPGIRRTPAARPEPRPEDTDQAPNTPVFRQVEPREAEIPAAALQALKTYCAACHGAAAKGGFQMFQGSQLTLSAEAIAGIADQVAAGAMPKYRPMPEAARKAILDWAQPFMNMQRN